jgi:hypothetical protein
MEYSIKVEEVLSRIINVKADSEDEAIAIIEEMYDNDKILLDSSHYNGQVMISTVRYQEFKVDEVLASKRLKE